MKRKFIMLLLAAASASVSCVKENSDVHSEETVQNQAMLTIAVNTGDAATKVPYTDALAYESQVNDVQVFVFDEKGRLNAYNKSTSVDGISIITTYGAKTVWAVVNGPDLKTVKTMSSLTSTVLDLSANSLTAADGFVMAGSAQVSVNKADVPASVDVSRLTARVAICNITNNLPVAYSDMTIESIVLANVVGNQNIAGSAEILTWYNKSGRKDGGDVNSIIDGSTNLASCPALTFHKPAEVIANKGKLDKTYCFYSYPNGTAADVSGWTNPFTPRKTKLVVTAVIAGEKYYYPVVLESLERNKAYTVNMTITALGSTDPDRKVEKGTIAATVTVLPWTPGPEYTETI